MALLVLAILLLLAFGLTTMQTRASQSALGEETRLALLLGREEIDAQMRLSLASGGPSAGIGPGVDVDYPLNGIRAHLRARWGQSASSSAHNPIALGWGGPDKFTSKDSTEFAFGGNDSEEVGDTVVSSGHTLLHLTSTAGGQGSESLSSYSHLFPYGIYAPLGKVSATKVSSFTNPTYDQGSPGVKDDESKVPLTTGRPVDIFAGDKLTVTDSYRVGRAMSLNGPISLPLVSGGSGAVPVGGIAVKTSLADGLFSGLGGLAQTVSQGATNKTELLDDELFSMEQLKRLFRGEVSALASIIGVGQASKVPFFPIPGVQNSAPVLIVYYMLCPYPVDFGGEASSTEGEERLGEIGQEIDEKEAKVTRIQQEIADERAQEKPDEDKITRLKGEVSDLKDEIENLKNEAKKIAKHKDKKKDDLASRLSGTEIPESAAQDDALRTRGWSYLYVIGNLFNIIMDLFRGRNPFEHIFAPTRVVHLGENDPEWSWPDGNLTMTGVLTVPPGRTLALKKQEVVVNGDVHLQQGAVLAVPGNFTIKRPTGWTDFGGTKPSDGHTLSYPKGRLIMEAGSSLVVDGSLTVDGGTYDEGSVLLVSPYGANHGITQLISAGQDVTIRYGMAPGVTMGDFIDDVAKDRSALKTFNDSFFQPLFLDLAPNLAKLPIGPWNKRKCYFADYATTIEFVPILEVFGLGGPWPIPLPFPNCLKKVFSYVSIVYSCELNATTGENFYTMSPFWFFGRGISPVLLKVRSELVADSISNLRWGTIAWDAFKNEGLKFVRDTLPEFAKDVIQNVILEVIEQVAKSMIPFKLPTCGGKEAKEADKIEDKAKEFLKETLKDFGKSVAGTFVTIVRRMKNDVYDKLDGQDERFSNLRELPGVVVRAGDEILVGTADTSKMAIGLFIAQRDVIIRCQKTIGTVVSLEGDVLVDELWHYPYFDRASLYNPRKLNVLESTLQFDRPKGSLAGDAASVFPRRLAEGFR